MWSTALVLMAALPAAGPVPARIAVLVDDPAPSEPARAAIEAELQALGYEVVSRELALDIRKVVTPKAILEGRLPAELSVLEADAILAGEAAYGPPTKADVTDSVQVALSARLLDLATSRISVTQQTSGVGLGVVGPNLAVRGAKQAVKSLFEKPETKAALEALGQQSGAVTLIVQDLPSRAALGELRGGLERALGGAPVREVYFARGLGKLLLGGSAAKSMNGPEVADLLSAQRELALDVGEVANTRIVARYDRARAVSLHLLVLEPRVPAKQRDAREELGRFVAGELAKLGYVKSSYQATPLKRARAMARAKEIGADMIVESELLVSGTSQALAIRMIDVATGQVVLREQKSLLADGSRFAAAEDLLGAIKAQLPERLASRQQKPQASEPAVAGAMK